MDDKWTQPKFSKEASHRNPPPSTTPKEFRHFFSSGMALDDLLCGDVYAWLVCDGMGSQLLFPPPVRRNERSATATQQIPQLSGSAPEPLVDTFVSVLLDALAREKMPHSFPLLSDFLKGADADSSSTHFAVPLLRYSVVGGNSPPNKLALYAGTRPSDFMRARKDFKDDWLWDIAAAAGFSVAWSDGGIDGREDTREGTPWTPHTAQSYYGDMQHWYSKRPGKVIGDWQFPTAAFADNLVVTARDNNTWLDPRRAAQYVCKVDGPQKMYPSSLYYPAVHPACPGNKAFYEHGLDYINSFLKLNRGKRRAGFMSFLEPHNTQRSYPGLDKGLKELVRRWTTQGNGEAMGKSAIFIWGDHGMHFTAESRTRSGRSARKQPAGWILLPKTWALKHPTMYRALVKNAANLVSHFDMHMTLRHLLTGSADPPPPDLDKLGGGKGETYAFKLANAGNIQSILSPIVKPRRSCAELGVPTSYCPCHVLECPKDLMRKEKVEERLQLIAEKVNEMFAKVRLDDICAPLVVDNGKRVFDQEIKARGASCEMQELTKGRVNLSLSLTQKEWKTKWRVSVNVNEEGEVEQIGDLLAESLWSPKWSECLPFIFKKFNVKSEAELNEKTSAYKARQLCYCKHLLPP